MADVGSTDRLGRQAETSSGRFPYRGVEGRKVAAPMGPGVPCGLALYIDEEDGMLRGMFTFGALLVGGLVALAVASALLLPVLALLTTLLVAAIKLAFFLAVVYFIVRLISPDTADRALEKIRSKIRRAA